MTDENDDIRRIFEERKKEGLFILGSPSGVGKTKMFGEFAKKFAGGGKPDDANRPCPAVIVTTSEDYKKAMQLNPAIADRISRMPIVEFKPIPPEAMVMIAQKLMAKAPLEAEERDALAEFIVGQYCAAGKIPDQGIRGMSKMIDHVMAAPLSPEAQASVIKRLLVTSPLAADQQAALAEVVTRQIDAQVHNVGNGGKGLKKAVDKTLEGPLPADMESVMIEKSPSYAAGVSRRNGDTLADGFTQGADVKPMKSIQFKRN